MSRSSGAGEKQSPTQVHLTRLESIGFYDARSKQLQNAAAFFSKRCKHIHRLMPGALKPGQSIASVLQSEFSAIRQALAAMREIVEIHKIEMRPMSAFYAKTKATKSHELNVAAALAHLRDVCEHASFALAFEFLRARIQAEAWRTAPPGGKEPRGFDVVDVVDYAMRRTDLSSSKAAASHILDEYLRHQSNVQSFRESLGRVAEDWRYERANKELEKRLVARFGRRFSTGDELSYLYELEAIRIPPIKISLKRTSFSQKAAKDQEHKEEGGIETSASVPASKKAKRQSSVPEKGFLSASWVNIPQEAERPMLTLTKSGQKLCAEPCRRKGSVTGHCWCPTTDGSWDYCQEKACDTLSK